MLSDYQKVLKKGYSILDTRTKYKVLTDGLCKYGRIDHLLVSSIEEKETPTVRKYMAQYDRLLYYYYERLIYARKEKIINVLSSWQIQTEITLKALKLVLFYLKALERINIIEVKNKYLSSHLAQRTKEIEDFYQDTEKQLEKIEKKIADKGVIETKGKEIEDIIRNIEEELGFKYQFSDAFDPEITT